MRIPVLLVLGAALLPVAASAAWQTLSAEQGKRIEIDRSSIKKDEGGKLFALGRIVLDRPITDARTASSYRIIEALSRYDCNARTYATVKRSYFREEGELLRQDDVKAQIDMPVRSGSLDDRLLREVCRPQPGIEAQRAAGRTASKVSAAAGELRKANEELVERELKRAGAGEPRPARPRPAPPASAPVRAQAPAAKPVADVRWAYDGDGGPDHWGKLKPEYATCASGKRQSPIDIRDGIGVDLEPIQFNYRPSPFRVVDNGHTIQVTVGGGSSITLLGKRYDLVQFHFHRPSEERINGKSFEMVAHLVHKAEDGRLAVVAVLLERGQEHPLIQTIWNNLPLERNEDVMPPGVAIDLAQLLPESRQYYTYMGSLTTPPCSEGVLWLVLKTPQQMSPEQMAIFARFYRNNARPVQPSFGRLIKESR
ncbi:MAG: carbonic anhydrase [Candidatus Accumulibacter sp.]|nr:carbonic anhydrase [Accumulibacter sp.]